jgi:hypothetical protein
MSHASSRLAAERTKNRLQESAQFLCAVAVDFKLRRRCCPVVVRFARWALARVVVACGDAPTAKARVTANWRGGGDGVNWSDSNDWNIGQVRREGAESFFRGRCRVTVWAGDLLGGVPEISREAITL